MPPYKLEEHFPAIPLPPSPLTQRKSNFGHCQPHRRHRRKKRHPLPSSKDYAEKQLPPKRKLLQKLCSHYGSCSERTSASIDALFFTTNAAFVASQPTHPTDHINTPYFPRGYLNKKRPHKRQTPDFVSKRPVSTSTVTWSPILRQEPATILPGSWYSKNKAATKIQAVLRGTKGRDEVKQLHHQTLVIQTHFR